MKEKGYIENHVRFLNDDGEAIVTLCVSGDIKDKLKHLLAAFKPDGRGYGLPQVIAGLGGHLVRPDVPDYMVEFVYFVSPFKNSPYVTVFDMKSNPDEPIEEGFVIEGADIEEDASGLQHSPAADSRGF